MSPRRLRQTVISQILALDLEAIAAVGLHVRQARVPLIGTFDLEAVRLVALCFT